MSVRHGVWRHGRGGVRGTPIRLAETQPSDVGDVRVEGEQRPTSEAISGRLLPRLLPRAGVGAA
jgi:hypothetical protein